MVFLIYYVYIFYAETEKAAQVPPAQGAYGTEVPHVDAAEGAHAAAPADARSICSTLTRYRLFLNSRQISFVLFYLLTAHVGKIKNIKPPPQKYLKHV